MSKPDYHKIVVQILAECQNLDYSHIAVMVAQQTPSAFVAACEDLGYYSPMEIMPIWVSQIATIGSTSKLQGIKQLRERINCEFLSAKLVVEALLGYTDRKWVLDAREMLLSHSEATTEDFIRYHQGSQYSREAIHDLVLTLKQSLRTKPLGK